MIGRARVLKRLDATRPADATSERKADRRDQGENRRGAVVPLASFKKPMARPMAWQRRMGRRSAAQGRGLARSCLSTAMPTAHGAIPRGSPRSHAAPRGATFRFDSPAQSLVGCLVSPRPETSLANGCLCFAASQGGIRRSLRECAASSARRGKGGLHADGRTENCDEGEKWRIVLCDPPWRPRDARLAPVGVF